MQRLSSVNPGIDFSSKSLESIGSKVAHELKNPLSAIKGLVQLLARNAADERSRERLEVVSGEVSRMEHILRDLPIPREWDDEADDAGSN